MVLGMAPSSITFRVLSHKVSHPERIVFGDIIQNSIDKGIENATMKKVYEWRRPNKIINLEKKLTESISVLVVFFSFIFSPCINRQRGSNRL